MTSVDFLAAAPARRVARAVGAQLLALIAATIIVTFLERVVGVRPASSVYLLAVAVIAVAFGSAAAAGTAIGSFLIYNFFFVEPRYTFTVAAPIEILNLLLLLSVGILIGRLAGLQRARARDAARREREARALFATSRLLASARRARDAFPAIVDRLASETRMSRIWIGLGATEAQEQILADSGTGPVPRVGGHFVLRRTPDERHSEWVRIKATGRHSEGPAMEHLYRVAITDGTDVIGSLWALRPTVNGPPAPEESRLLAATADGVGQSVLRDRLAVQATELEIAQRSDELKTALLDTVSHDLRTPLATIRAAAGSLADGEIAWTDDDRERTARQIDFEAERLNRIVSNLLDMSRIQAGALRPEIEVLPVDEVCRTVLRTARPWLGNRPVHIEIGADLPAVMADPVLLEESMTNLLENVVRYTPAEAAVRLSAAREGDRIILRVDDAGPGLPPEAMARIFEKFYRDPSTRRASGRGTGLGLAVVEGMVEAMGGTVTAGKSDLGGLMIRIELPAGAPAPDGELVAASDVSAPEASPQPVSGPPE
jgi:two-component system, OmpR family, sensor histidine kinase KdpD